MNNYKKIAIRYLKLNKRRSVITIVAVVVAVTILYTMLNLGWCALLNQRKELRKEHDYEIVFLTESQSQIEQIMADSKIKSASIGSYYDYGYYKSVMYEHALYINTTNPYRLDKIKIELEEKYGVKSYLNDSLAWTYLQGGDGNTTVIIILLSLLVSFIFAIFGVGVVRNSIQLSTLEQIKDYGNMRCIGASKGQLKAIIYMEGAILELTGNAIGVMIGFIVSYVIGLVLKWEVGFHIIPLLPILIAFLGDLYFAMDENCKVVSNMSPVSAIRGEFRIREEKMKARKKSIFEKIFGVEGDYAYKSIMRSPGRFMKTVWALGMAVAAFITMAGVVNSFYEILEEMQKEYKYYQVYFETINTPLLTAEEVKSTLPSTEVLKNISELEEVTEAKRIYSTDVILADVESFFNQYTQPYLQNTMIGNMYYSLKEEYDKNKTSESSEQPSSNITYGYSMTEIPSMLAKVTCYGYDESDYKRCEEYLVEGTLDISENGIILMNAGKTASVEYDGLYMDEMEVTYTNYKVGDTIDIVDMNQFQTRMDEGLQQLQEEYKVKEKNLSDEYEGDALAAKQEELEDEYYSLKHELYINIRQQLINEGLYKTYIIEGILEDDANHINEGEPRFILPLEQYYAFTGTDESMISGMQYHFDKFSYTRYSNALSTNAEELYYYGYQYFDCNSSGYVDNMYVIEGMKKFGIGVGIGVLFVVLMSIFNIINTTASNLHLRKKELAQLRVIGVSKKRLMKMVMLEGVISSIVANIIGIVLGIFLSYFTFEMGIGILFGADYAFPILAAIIGIVASTLVLCGSVYAPLRELKQDIAGDLAIGGE